MDNGDIEEILDVGVAEKRNWIIVNNWSGMSRSKEHYKKVAT